MFIKTKILSVSCVFLCLKSKYLSFIYYPTSAKDLKKISAKFRQWQDINQERATGLTPTRAMAPLICELWQDWYSVTLSDLWSHHCAGSGKNSRHSFSLWPVGTALKLPFKSCNLITLKSWWGTSSCIECVQSFGFLPKNVRSTFSGNQTMRKAKTQKEGGRT